MGLEELRDYNGNNEELLNYLPQVLFSSQKVVGLVTGLKLMNIWEKTNLVEYWESASYFKHSGLFEIPAVHKMDILSVITKKWTSPNMMWNTTWLDLRYLITQMSWHIHFRPNALSVFSKTPLLLLLLEFVASTDGHLIGLSKIRSMGCIKIPKSALFSEKISVSGTEVGIIASLSYVLFKRSLD